MDPRQQSLASYITSIVTASGGAKAVASLITYPHEVIRTRLRQPPTGADGSHKYKSVVQTLRLILKEEGAGALYGGLTAQMLRVVPMRRACSSSTSLSRKSWARSRPVQPAKFYGAIIHMLAYYSCDSRSRALSPTASLVYCAPTWSSLSCLRHRKPSRPHLPAHLELGARANKVHATHAASRRAAPMSAPSP